MKINANILFSLFLIFFLILRPALARDAELEISHDPDYLESVFEPFDVHTNKKLISHYNIPHATTLYHNWISQKELTNNCSELIGTCEYYLCRESQKNCNADGYFISFGYQYCSESLINLSNEVSVKGKTWLINVATCLQGKMEEVSNENSCSRIKKLAIRSHDECYTETNFCSLKIKDTYKILKILRPEFGDARIMFEGLQIIKECKKGAMRSLKNLQV